MYMIGLRGLEMVVEVRGIDEQKLSKINKLNLRDKFKKWFKKAVALIDWQAMKVAML